MLSANFKPKTAAAASRGSLATVRISCFGYDGNQNQKTETHYLFAKVKLRKRLNAHLVIKFKTTTCKNRKKYVNLSMC